MRLKALYINLPAAFKAFVSPVKEPFRRVGFAAGRCFSRLTEQKLLDIEEICGKRVEGLGTMLIVIRNLATSGGARP